MSTLGNWLPNGGTAVDTQSASPWSGWMQTLKLHFSGQRGKDRTRIEVLDRVSLGGKKSLVLISVDGRRMLVGVGEEAAPTISPLDAPLAGPSPRAQPGLIRFRRSSQW
jgi:Flagellar biosynthesis protein, FliO